MASRSTPSPPSVAPGQPRTPRASSGCWAAAEVIRQGWRPCSSMRRRRSTWRASRTPTKRGWSGPARRSTRARGARRWTACAAPALVAPDDADDDPLDYDVALVDAQRRHGGVGGFEPDPAPGLAIELLDRSARPVDQRDHGLAVVGIVALVHDHVIPVLNMLLDHPPA